MNAFKVCFQLAVLLAGLAADRADERPCGGMNSFLVPPEIADIGKGFVALVALVLRPVVHPGNVLCEVTLRGTFVAAIRASVLLQPNVNPADVLSNYGGTTRFVEAQVTAFDMVSAFYVILEQSFCQVGVVTFIAPVRLCSELVKDEQVYFELGWVIVSSGAIFALQRRLLLRG